MTSIRNADLTEYHFEKMPLEERRTYVSDKERINYCERMNSYRNMILFDDKGLTYSFFRRYYHRDLVEVFSKREYELFAAFLKKHPKFIVKPFDGACGVGVRIPRLQIIEPCSKGIIISTKVSAKDQCLDILLFHLQPVFQQPTIERIEISVLYRAPLLPIFLHLWPLSPCVIPPLRLLFQHLSHLRHAVTLFLLLLCLAFRATT